MRRARVFGAIDAVAEAGDLFLARQLAADEGIDAIGRRVEADSSSIFITSALAPPCSGPLSVPMPATTAECTSVNVAAATRAANVEALSS